MSRKTSIAYHLWKARLPCRTVWYDPGISHLVASSERSNSLFIHRRVLVRTRSSLHDRVIQLPQDFYTVSPVAEIRSIWFSRPFYLFSILPHKNQKLWLFFFYVSFRLVNSTRKDRTTCPLLQRDMPPSTLK